METSLVTTVENLMPQKIPDSEEGIFKGWSSFGRVFNELFPWRERLIYNIHCVTALFTLVPSLLLYIGLIRSYMDYISLKFILLLLYEIKESRRNNL